jgi:hypothetical protein
MLFICPICKVKYEGEHICDIKVLTNDVKTVPPQPKENYKEYTKVFCSKCIDGEIIYKINHTGFYCTNPKCEFHIRKINIREQ